jgi:hypothetical protein
MHGPSWKFEYWVHNSYGLLRSVCGRCLPMIRDNLSVPSWPLMTEPVDCSETSTNYQYTLCHNTEDRITHLHRGGRLKSLLIIGRLVNKFIRVWNTVSCVKLKTQIGVSENSALRRLFGSNGDQELWWRRKRMLSFINCTDYQIALG